MRLQLLLLLPVLLLSACDEGDILRERAIEFSVAAGQVALAPSETRQVRVTLCPAIRTGTDQGTNFIGYQPGGYTLGTIGLPPGVTARFIDGDAMDMPLPVFGADGRWSRSRQDPYPDAGATTDTRFCWERTLELNRSAAGGTTLTMPAAVTLRIVQPATVALTELAIDQTYTAALPVLLVDPGAGAPPVTGSSCPADQLLAGRWQDVGAPASRETASHLMGFALAQDRPLVARARLDGTVFIDEWTGAAWAAESLVGAGSIEALRLAVWRDPDNGNPRRFVVWVATDFNRPVADQSVLQVAERAGDGAWSPIAMPVADLQQNFRSLQLVAWRGDAVVAWLRPDGMALRRGRPQDGYSSFTRLPLPVDAPATGTTRELRLAVDPVDEALVLALAQLDSDGITRLRAWLLATADGAWQALPPLDAGPAGGLTAGLASLAATAQAGTVTLAWSFGDALFGSNARLALSVARHAGGAWEAVGDAAALADAGRRYALQPLGLAVAPTCSGGVFLAWHETQQYPTGAVFGAQHAAQGGWDPLGHSRLATLPDGTGSYASSVAIATGSDGRPVLAALMAPPSGGNPVLVVRRFGP